MTNPFSPTHGTEAELIRRLIRIQEMIETVTVQRDEARAEVEKWKSGYELMANLSKETNIGQIEVLTTERDEARAECRKLKTVVRCFNCNAEVAPPIYLWLAEHYYCSICVKEVIDNLRSERDELKTEVERLIDEVVTVIGDRLAAEGNTARLTADRDKARAEIERLERSLAERDSDLLIESAFNSRARRERDSLNADLKVSDDKCSDLDAEIERITASRSRERAYKIATLEKLDEAATSIGEAKAKIESLLDVS